MPAGRSGVTTAHPRKRTPPPLRHTGDQIEGGALAGAVGPVSSPTISPARFIDSHQPTELLATAHLQQQLTGPWLGAPWQRRGAGLSPGPARRGEPALDEALTAPQTLSTNHQHDAEDDGPEVRAGPDQPRQEQLELVVLRRGELRLEPRTCPRTSPMLLSTVMNRDSMPLSIPTGDADAALEEREAASPTRRPSTAARRRCAPWSVRSNSARLLPRRCLPFSEWMRGG